MVDKTLDTSVHSRNVTFNQFYFWQVPIFNFDRFVIPNSLKNQIIIDLRI